MNRHPYLCAYMAGITVPTLFLLVVMTFFILSRHIYNVSLPIERVIVFPMAMVPNLWGAWNILYVWIRPNFRWNLGFHGAILPFVLAPLGFVTARILDFAIPAFVATAFPVTFPVIVVLYYLAWKYLVGFLNELLGNHPIGSHL